LLALRPLGWSRFVLGRSGDLSEAHKNPIPSRTRPLNASAPMVLCLKTRESRSLPDLPRTKPLPSLPPLSTTRGGFCVKRRAFVCRPSSPGSPAIPALGDAGWSSPVARQAHNLKVTGSNPVPATNRENPCARTASGVFACREPPPAPGRSTAKGRWLPSSASNQQTDRRTPKLVTLSSG
jgi:hypothetical protein